MKQIIASVASILALLLLAGCVSVPNLQEQARAELFKQLQEAKSWQRIHAAEELCKAGILSDEITSVYESEYLASPVKDPYRVGCIRVLYRNCPEKRNALRAELLSIAFDRGCPGDAHAAETIGKLGIIMSPEELSHMRPYLAKNDSLGQYAILPFVFVADPEIMPLWKQRVEQHDNCAVGIGTYVDELPEECSEVLRQARFDNGGDEWFRVFSFGSYLRHCRITNADYYELWRRIEEEGPSVRRFYLNSVGDIGSEKDAEKLEKYLHDEDGEVRIAAAGSILRIGNRCALIPARMDMTPRLPERKEID